ncbi:MAG: hypothetical protein HUU33_13390, partial [Flavobacteriales bacterium]|nr:hypothetical protein [Flavobacteriales bacterium]
MNPSLPTWATFVPRFGVSVEANLKLCAELEVRYLELNARQFLANPDPDHGAALRAVWAEAEVTISSVHGPFGLDVSLAAEDDAVRVRAVEHWRRLLPSCAAAGARVVVAHPHADRTPPADR